LHWLGIFAAPFEEPEMFWIIIPIWINWAITEFYQEKHGTDFGNAISNGAIALFASVDWARYLFRQMSNNLIHFTFNVFLKFFAAFAVLFYGCYVVYSGIKRNSVASFIGKIRWVTYLLLMFTPIVYGVKKMDVYTLFSIVIFFPLYWWVIEIFDRITPDKNNSPKADQRQAVAQRSQQGYQYGRNF